MTPTNEAGHGLPELPLKRIVVSLLVAAQVPLVAWISGVNFTERSSELGVTYAAFIYLAIAAYMFPAWNRYHD